MSALTPSRLARPRLARLVLPLAGAALMALAAASPTAAVTSCQVTKSKACAHDGGFCGTRKDPGRCETYRHRTYRGPTQVSCACRPDHPPHT